MRMDKLNLNGVCFLLFCMSCTTLAQKSFDSLKIRRPKHYFSTVIIADGYRKPNRDLEDTSTSIGKRLKSYGVRQSYVGFYTPLYTFVKDDTITNRVSNIHLLLTGNFLSLRPQFDGLTDHKLVKFGVGMRLIYNTGKKGVWFFDVSPFVTRDANFRSIAYRRLASTIVYSHNVSEKFNWRLGLTKSFMWGNRLYLPFVGLRFGKLDDIHLSIQFPRSIHLSLPVSDKLVLSVYTRPQGGMFVFSNTDSLYFRRSDSYFHFTRYEINTGFRADVRFGSHFALYLASGISSRNNITLYSERANRSRRNAYYNAYFFSRNMPPGLFLNVGLVFSFGKTRTVFSDRNIYDAIDLNNTSEHDNSNLPVPIPPKKRSLMNLESVQDLVDYNDF